MPLQHYGVLKGRAIAAQREDGASTPHYQVYIMAGEAHYRIAVNVKSQSKPSELLFLVDDQFAHPITAPLGDLPLGWSELRSQPGGVALDFIRGNLFKRGDMRELPSSLPGPDNDLSDQLEHYIERAINEEQALVYAFGQRWGPETQADKIFGFKPGNGVHDIHMNQGNVSPFLKDDGVWQDGGLLIAFAVPAQWVGIFLAFQSQAWHTDDATGHTIPDVDIVVTEQIVRIVGALVNPIGPAPEHETVTLLNASPNAIDLSGWQIADRLKHKHTLAGTLAPGATVVVALPPTVQLGNRGGLITLLNKQGLKVDGVSYTQAQAREGWTIVF
jgi:uncharacterized protein YukJ